MVRSLRLLVPLLLAVLVTTSTAIAEDAPKPGSSPPSEIDLSEYAGKVVYLDFWASWCAPCKKSFPWMIGLQEKLGEDGLAVVTVNVDRDRAKADRFLEDLESSLPVIYDPEGKIAGSYALEAMPSSYIYGRDGKLRTTHLGFAPDRVEDVEAELRALLAEGEADEAGD